ncbi:MAG: response regulator [Chloroflexi bacterium]|nr:response regulator [Chloroflexota bacterium]
MMSNLLLIEDDTELRKVLTEAVELDGYVVEIARNAEEGLKLLGDGYQPSAIICDISLPHMDGLEFLSHVRQKPCCIDVLFIAMSGSMALKQKALDAGADYYLIKPFSFQELYAMLAREEPPQK